MCPLPRAHYHDPCVHYDVSMLMSPIPVPFACCVLYMCTTEGMISRVSAPLETAPRHERHSWTRVARRDERPRSTTTAPQNVQAFKFSIYLLQPVSRRVPRLCVRRASDCAWRALTRSHEIARDRHEIGQPPAGRCASVPRPETIFTTDIASGLPRTASLRAARVIVGCP